MWKVENDGSILDAKGNVVVFGAERFMKDVIAGNACFLCGVRPQERPFKDLLVLPEWLQSRYELAAKTVRKPNGSTVRCDQDTVPCCRSCNILINDEIEKPVSQVIAKGGGNINTFIQSNGLGMLYIWMALVFVKTHLKENLRRYRIDPSEANFPDAHEWSKLHLVHSFVRAALSRTEVNAEATGSFLTLPVDMASVAGGFDYADVFGPQTLMVRFDDCAVFVVFDDTGAALNCIHPKLAKITGPLSEVQLREVLAELAYLNMLLKTRPTYKTHAELETEILKFVATRPQLALKDPDLALRGKVLRAVLGDGVDQIKVEGHTPADVSAAVDAGTVTFLFDGEGRFIANSYRPA